LKLLGSLEELGQLCYLPLFRIPDHDSVDDELVLLNELLLAEAEVVDSGINHRRCVLRDGFEDNVNEFHIQRGGKKCGEGVIDVLLRVLDILFVHEDSETAAELLLDEELEVRLSDSDDTHHQPCEH
jgi:hypothetical protein